MKRTIPSQALAIIRTLQKQGYQALFAGGCVRDMLLGLSPCDWDIATSARPEEVEALFDHTIPVGKQFGIIVVVMGSESYEVATFRGEGTYSDGRHPDEIHFTAAKEDVLRRDFTINAMLYDPVADELMDWVGGEADLRGHIIRAVGDPRRRFAEDKLRVIRAVRFAARFGYAIDAATFAAMKCYSAEIPRCVSPERIAAETEKMLMGGHSARAFDLMEQSGILAACFPQLAAMKGVEQPPQFHPEGDVWQHTLKVLSKLDDCTAICRVTEDAISCPPEERFAPGNFVLQRATAAELRGLCWGALLHDVGKPTTFFRGEDRIHFNGHDAAGAPIAETMMRSLRLPKETTAIALYLVKAHMNQMQLAKARVATRRRHLQEPYYPLLIELVREDALGSCGDLTNFHTIRQWWIEEMNTPKPVKPTITGHDLLSLGLKPSPRFGEILKAAADYELEHPFDDHNAAMVWLKNHLQYR